MAIILSLTQSFCTSKSSKKSKISLQMTQMLEENFGLNTREYPDDNFDHIRGLGSPSDSPSRLQQICSFKLKDVQRLMEPIDTDGCGIDRSLYLSMDDLMEEWHDFDAKYGKPLNLYDMLVGTQGQAVAAEFKRASPSKGVLNMNADPVQQCSQYACVGASVISVLTEFKHFKGTLGDMRAVRIALQKERGELRPAILRKDFILDKYQIAEARANGADTLLLIVAILGRQQLSDYIAYSRALGMEPLVEVHDEVEVDIALDAGAKCIGVNNRDLHTFLLDMESTSRCVQRIKQRGVSLAQAKGDNGVVLASLSGFRTTSDVDKVRQLGVKCFLVGETLMKATDPAGAIQALLAPPTSVCIGAAMNPLSHTPMPRSLVKVCGVTTKDGAAKVVMKGVNLLGLIFAPSKRQVCVDEARAISGVVRAYGEREGSSNLAQRLAAIGPDVRGVDYWQACAEVLSSVTLNQPLTVGVFQDASVADMARIIEKTEVDIVQLHGNECPEGIEGLSVPVIKVLHVGATPDVKALRSAADQWEGVACALILDTCIDRSSDSDDSADGPRWSGGAGQRFDWSVLEALALPVIVAGGLSPDSAAEAASLTNAIGVDVSSGVEVSPGVKDIERVETFVANAKRRL